MTDQKEGMHPLAATIVATLLQREGDLAAETARGLIECSTRTARPQQPSWAMDDDEQRHEATSILLTAFSTTCATASAGDMALAAHRTSELIAWFALCHVEHGRARYGSRSPGGLFCDAVADVTMRETGQARTALLEANLDLLKSAVDNLYRAARAVSVFPVRTNDEPDSIREARRTCWEGPERTERDRLPAPVVDEGLGGTAIGLTPFRMLSINKSDRAGITQAVGRAMWDAMPDPEEFPGLRMTTRCVRPSRDTDLWIMPMMIYDGHVDERISARNARAATTAVEMLSCMWPQVEREEFEAEYRKAEERAAGRKHDATRAGR